MCSFSVSIPGIMPLDCFWSKQAAGLISVFREGVWAPSAGSLKDLCANHSETIFVSHAGIHADALTLIKTS